VKAAGAVAKAGPTSWYAVYTRHQHEKWIERHLARLGFEVFVPLYREVHQWKDRRKEVILPLFPCYVFLSGGLDRQLEILNTPGVYSLVSYGGKVASIEAEELEAVRRVVASCLRFEPHCFLQTGSRVRVHGGPLTGLEGIVARKKESFRIVLSVEILCRSVAVEVDEALVELVP
jgi:transcription antitermination factor NusG